MLSLKEVAVSEGELRAVKALVSCQDNSELGAVTEKATHRLSMRVW